TRAAVAASASASAGVAAIEAVFPTRVMSFVTLFIAANGHVPTDVQARVVGVLTLAVLLAKISGIEHAFWVVVATLTVLRSNVATTGTTIVSAVFGNLAGVLLATVATLAIGAHAAPM